MKLKNNHFTKNELNQIDEADGLIFHPFVKMEKHTEHQPGYGQL